MRVAYASAGFHAANTRHVYVQQDSVTFALVQREKCFFAAGCLTRARSHRFKRNRANSGVMPCHLRQSILGPMLSCEYFRRVRYRNDKCRRGSNVTLDRDLPAMRFYCFRKFRAVGYRQRDE
jgi:hypothetical protein